MHAYITDIHRRPRNCPLFNMDDGPLQGSLGGLSAHTCLKEPIGELRCQPANCYDLGHLLARYCRLHNIP